MKYLGIDYGAKRIGLSVSDADGKIAFPRTSIPNDATLETFIADVIRNENIGTVIVGDTRALSGEKNPITKEAEEFVVELASHVGVPIKTIWEGWSSREASRYAPKGREHDDAAAAAIILQRYLDFNA